MFSGNIFTPKAGGTFTHDADGDLTDERSVLGLGLQGKGSINEIVQSPGDAAKLPRFVHELLCAI